MQILVIDFPSKMHINVNVCNHLWHTESGHYHRYAKKHRFLWTVCASASPLKCINDAGLGENDLKLSHRLDIIQKIK